MDVLDRIAFDRSGVLTVRPADRWQAQAGALVLAELARVGVRVTNPAALDGRVLDVPSVVAHVRTRRGQRGVYSPLFDGFPDALPAFDDVRLRAVLGTARLAGREDPTPEQVRSAFDFSDLGWWPASSVGQDVPRALLTRTRQEVLPGDDLVQWWDVTLTDPAGRDDTLRAWMADAFATPTSLRADVRDDLVTAAGLLGVDHVDPLTVTFRETRTVLTALVWEADRDRIPTLGLSPDDVLRLFAHLTGTDTSLATPVRYPRLSRPERRTVLATLEASPRLADVFRRRDLWLAIGRGLHVGAATWAPRTREVFERLRASPHDATSLGSRVERALRTGRYTDALEVLVAEAPGVLLRRLRHLAALAGDDATRTAALLTATAQAASLAPVRLVLTARAQVADNGATYPRIAVTKAGAARAITRTPGHLRLTLALRAELLEVLTRAARAELAARGSWSGERVFLADGVDRLLVPDALRSTSDGVVQVERGSALPGGDGAVLRLFVHWKHPHSDLDLSCLALGEDFDLLAHVSWTNLRDGAVVHSGDLTSAPAGAQEFIDIDLEHARDKALEAGWRYLAPAVFRYSGPTFDGLEEAVVGWMLRDAVTADRATFDPATVVNAFTLTGSGRTALPFVWDVLTGEVLYVDLYLPGGARARVENQDRNVGFLVRAVLARRSTKVDVPSLVLEHVAARGAEVVAERATATITVGTSDSDTYNVLRPEKLLADLL